jgi:hypothetical protein
MQSPVERPGFLFVAVVVARMSSCDMRDRGDDPDIASAHPVYGCFDEASMPLNTSSRLKAGTTRMASAGTARD